MLIVDLAHVTGITTSTEGKKKYHLINLGLKIRCKGTAGRGK